MAQRRLNLVLNLDTGAYSGRLAQAGGQMRKFSGDVNKTANDVAKLGGGFSALSGHMDVPRQKLRDYVLILGNIHFALLNVQQVMVGWVTALVKQSAEVERMTVLMKGMSNAQSEVGKNKDAENSLRTLFDMSRKNGMAVSQLTDAFVKFKSAGIDPLNGSLNSMVQAVSFFGGTSEVMHRASIAIQQMAGKGVISMEELRQQLGEAVPTAIQDMARAMGKSMKDFTKEVAEGSVQAKPALEAMFREWELMYAGAGERMSQTLTGQMQEFRTNMTELSTSFTELGQNDGMFAGVVSSIREINAAMMAPEGKQFMRDLGAFMNGILQTMMSVGRFVVTWRSEIGAAITGVAAAFAAMKALAISKWFAELGRQAALSGRTMFSSLEPSAGVLGSINARMRELAETQTRAHNVEVARQATAQRVLSTSTQQIASLTQEASKLRERSAAIQHNLNLLQQQRSSDIAQLNTAKTLHQANLAVGRSGVESAQRVQAAQAKLNATNAAIIRSRGQLRTVTAASAATEVAFARTVDQAAAAQGRLSVSTTGAIAKLNLKAVAARGVAAAVRFMGAAVNLALGPIGAIAIALGFAAHQAGLFETAADKAAAAAARLAQGMATAEDMKSFVANRDKLRSDLASMDAELSAGEAYVSDGEGGFHRRGLSPRARAALQKRRDATYAQLQKGEGQIKFAQNIIDREAGTNAGQSMVSSAEYVKNANAATYASIRQKADEQYGAGSPQAIAASNAAMEYLTKANRNFVEVKRDEILALRQQALATGGSLAVTDAMLAAYDAGTGQTNDFSQSLGDLQTAAMGAADAKSKSGSAAEKAANAYQNAREKYQNMMANLAGSVAQLEDQLNDGNGAFAKFQAQMSMPGGKYAEATAEELNKLGEAFLRIDELQAQLDLKQALDGMSSEVKGARIEADLLWQSIADGTWDTMRNEIRIRSQFEGLIDTFKGNFEAVDKLKAKMTELINETNRLEGARLVWDLEEETRKMNIDMLPEDRQRDQAELDHLAQQEWLKVEAIRQGTVERQQAESAYYLWREAQERKLARLNESQIISMSRDWAKLGLNIDNALSGALDSFVSGMADGSLHFGDFAKDLIKHLVKIILQAMVAYAILSAIGATTGSFGDYLGGQLGGFNAGFSQQGAGAGDGTNMTGAITRYHTGGWIGQQALKPGEVPLIGKEGEVMLNEDHQRFYRDALSGAAGASAPSVTLNVINNSGTDLNAEQSDPHFNGREMIIDVVVEAMSKQGPLRDSFQHLARSN